MSSLLSRRLSRGLFFNGRSSLVGCAAGRPSKVSRLGRAMSDATDARSAIDDARSAILRAAATHVAAHGFSAEALAMGAKDAGVSAAFHGVFERGPVELVEAVAAQSLEDLHAALNDQAEELKIFPDWKTRLAFAIDLRLRLSLPYRAHRPQALALMLRPQDIATNTVVDALSQLADGLARATLVEGEPVDGASWRYRRTVAAGTYALAEVYALSDTSAQLESTSKFAKDVLSAAPDAVASPEGVAAALRSAMETAASVASAALSAMPPGAVGALPRMVHVLASNAGGVVAQIAESSFAKLLESLPATNQPMPPKRCAESPPSAATDKEEQEYEPATTTTDKEAPLSSSS